MVSPQPSRKWRLECYPHIGPCAHLTGGPTEAVGTQVLRDLRQRKDWELSAELSSGAQGRAAPLSLSSDPPSLLWPGPVHVFLLWFQHHLVGRPGVSGSCFPCRSPSAREEKVISSGKSEVLFSRWNQPTVIVLTSAKQGHNTPESP